MSRDVHNHYPPGSFSSRLNMFDPAFLSMALGHIWSSLAASPEASAMGLGFTVGKQNIAVRFCDRIRHDQSSNQSSPCNFVLIRRICAF